MSERIIVIADIHNYTRWIESALEKYKKELKYDKVIFLGDYFDNFNDNQFIAAGTAKWLKESLKDPERIHLLGNHDMPYMIPFNDSLHCPGYNKHKMNAINAIITQEDWSKFKAAHYDLGWVFSHAGFTTQSCSCPINGNYTAEQLIIKAEEGLAEVKKNQAHALFLPGYRMGEDRIGGITWCDWDHEFYPYPGINQIVGHTPNHKPRRLNKKDSVNYCVDTQGRFAIFLEANEIIFINNV